MAIASVRKKMRESKAKIHGAKPLPKSQQRGKGEVQNPAPKIQVYSGFTKGVSGNPATQFKPGVVVNPDGRRGKTPVTDALRKYLSMPYQGPNRRFKVRNYTNSEALAVKVAETALEGDMRATEFVLDRTEGKVPNPTTLSGPNGGPIDIAAMSPEEKAARIAELSARMISAGDSVDE